MAISIIDKMFRLIYNDYIDKLRQHYFQWKLPINSGYPGGN